MSANPQENTDQYKIDPNVVAAEEPEEEEDKPDPVALQSQLRELELKLSHSEELKEKAEEQAGYWFEQSEKKHAVDPPAPVLQEPDIDISDDEWNEAVSDKRKFIGLMDRVATKRAESIATKITDSKANAITGEQRRLQSAWLTEQQRVPELADNKHPLTQLFAEKVRAMQNDEEYQGVDPVMAMRMAIREAESEYLRKGGTVNEEAEEVKETVPRNLDRKTAIAAQSGSKGRKTTAPVGPQIPADQMAMIEKHARGLGIPVEKIIANMPNVVKFRG